VPTYECRLYLLPEVDGGFSAIVPGLPGVASQGDTEAEAIANVCEAFQGVVETYRDYDEPIPWADPEDVEPMPANAKERHVLVECKP
jgi:predicted RNase H-like HicB family nuclease